MTTTPLLTTRTVLEICVEDVAGAVSAERSGADRIELCTNLTEGGTTPSLDTVATVLESVSAIDVQVLIRERPGDFVYSAEEVEAMRADIVAIHALPRPDGVTLGFVIGALTADAKVDERCTLRLLEACGPVPVTFHRAFDDVHDLRESLQVVTDLGFNRVLTAGGQPTAEAGLRVLADLVDRSDSTISVLAAGGIRAHNVAEIVRRTGVDEVHFRAHGDPGATSAQVIRAVIAELAKAGL